MLHTIRLPVLIGRPLFLSTLVICSQLLFVMMLGAQQCVVAVTVEDLQCSEGHGEIRLIQKGLVYEEVTKFFPHLPHRGSFVSDSLSVISTT